MDYTQAGDSNEAPKRRYKKTVLACLPCQKGHYSCDENRPCSRCVRRGRPEECVDGRKKRAKYMEAAVLSAPTRSNDQSERLLLLARSANTEEPDLIAGCYGDVHPFNYGSAYHRLLETLQRRLNAESMTRVCRALATFRPTSIAQIRTLQEPDLLLMERAFQRTILELQRVLPLTGAAYCVWRRTGEICLASREFCILTGWPNANLVDGRRSIHELLDERGVVAYWEQYARCVIDSAEHYFSVSTGMFRPDGRCVQGALWVTVRKDIFDIPLAIVGCFLPNLWATAAPPVDGGGVPPDSQPSHVNYYTSKGQRGRLQL